MVGILVESVTAVYFSPCTIDVQVSLIGGNNVAKDYGWAWSQKMW